MNGQKCAIPRNLVRFAGRIVCKWQILMKQDNRQLIKKEVNQPSKTMKNEQTVYENH